MERAEIVRFADLEPSWHVPKAKEPGFMRWLVTLVGGPEGYINQNRGVAALSNDAIIGFMGMPAGNRQAGLHAHTITEIYVVLKGRIEGYDGEGEVHRAGPLDCVYIPAGVPHGVRAVGNEDVLLVWLHDALEKKGSSVYFQGPITQPQTDKVSVVSLDALDPNWTGHRAKEPEFMRWSASWIGGPTGFVNHHPAQSVISDKIGVGLTVILPANKVPRHSHDGAMSYVVLKGKMIADCGEGNREIGRLDCLRVPAGIVHALRNHGEEPAYVMCVQESPHRQTNFQD